MPVKDEVFPIDRVRISNFSLVMGLNELTPDCTAGSLKATQGWNSGKSQMATRFSKDWKLANAASSGKWAQVQKLLSEGANPNSRDRLGWSVLHLAAASESRNAIEAVRALLDAGADPNAPLKYGQLRPLMSACRLRNRCGVDIVKLLLKHGADATVLAEMNEDEYFSALMYAVDSTSRDAPEVVALLLKRGADATGQGKLDLPHITAAVRQPNYRKALEMLEALCAHGADINHVHCGEDEKTPLMIAAAECHPEIVRWLLEHGAEVNARSGIMRTALMEACLSQHNYRKGIERVKLLLNAGARIDLEDEYGMTAEMLLDGRTDNTAKGIRRLLQARS